MVHHKRMNIKPVNPNEITEPAIPRSSGAISSSQPSVPEGDSFKPEQTQRIMNTLHGQPSVRPAVVERGKNMASDPNYPPFEALAKLAELMIRKHGK